jgi:glycosyltransferase involved in cell wall biosynthesis
MKNDSKIVVSVIIPVYNEEKYINQCIQSLLKQDYPKEKAEFIFVDGNSTDKTVEILNDYIKKFPIINLLHNEKRTVPYSMNIGIDNAKGDYIVRIDGHSEYADDYISKCIEYLDKTGADNVGGHAISKSRGYIGNAISIVLSSKFGVGNSDFRTGGKEGYVDTVPFGAFRREIFSKYGLYDIRLTRNQDIELNHRIIKNGGKIFLTPSIKLFYYNREELPEFIKQSYLNGYWNIITWHISPGSLSFRHFVPFAFILSLILLPIFIIFINIELFKWILLIDIYLYITINVIFSIKETIIRNIKYLAVLPFIFCLLHCSYGLGSLIGFKRVIYESFENKKNKSI